MTGDLFVCIYRCGISMHRWKGTFTIIKFCTLFCFECGQCCSTHWVEDKCVSRKTSKFNSCFLLIFLHFYMCYDKAWPIWKISIININKHEWVPIGVNDLFQARLLCYWKYKPSALSDALNREESTANSNFHWQLIDMWTKRDNNRLAHGFLVSHLKVGYVVYDLVIT